jgi:NAD-dependent SIR2 family protein deacetylase
VRAYGQVFHDSMSQHHEIISEEIMCAKCYINMGTSFKVYRAMRRVKMVCRLLTCIVSARAHVGTQEHAGSYYCNVPYRGLYGT